jgi:hypothetical protein
MTLVGERFAYKRESLDTSPPTLAGLQSRDYFAISKELSIMAYIFDVLRQWLLLVTDILILIGLAIWMTEPPPPVLTWYF